MTWTLPVIDAILGHAGYHGCSITLTAADDGWVYRIGAVPDAPLVSLCSGRGVHRGKPAGPRILQELGTRLIKPASPRYRALRACGPTYQSRKRTPPPGGWRYEYFGVARQAEANQPPTPIPRPPPS